MNKRQCCFPVEISKIPSVICGACTVLVNYLNIIIMKIIPIIIICFQFLFSEMKQTAQFKSERQFGCTCLCLYMFFIFNLAS